MNFTAAIEQGTSDEQLNRKLFLRRRQIKGGGTNARQSATSKRIAAALLSPAGWLLYLRLVGSDVICRETTNVT